MNNRNLVATFAASLILFNSAVTFAADQMQTEDQDRKQQTIQAQDQDRSRTQDRSRDREKIYGNHLMTSQERSEYQTNMRNMKTQQERESYRIEHHKRMQERAQQRNIEARDSSTLKGGGGSGSGRRGR